MSTVVLDGPVTLIESSSDPGDMGEPRKFSEDGMTYVVVPSWEDAALGAAWRRCEAALPEGWRVSTVGQNYDGDEWHASAWDRKTGAATTGRGPTPTAALEALAEKLEGIDG